MISCTLFDDIGVCLLELAGQVTAQDLDEASQAVNEYLAKHQHFNGLVVHAEFFPWWADFAALVGHLKFSGNCHQTLVRVAICSDIDMAGLLPTIGDHFFAAEVRSYKDDQVSEAMHWVQRE